MKKTYYAYKITDRITNEFYYGSRTCYGSATNDFHYLGSMKTWNPNKQNLIKEIIKDDFITRDDAVVFDGHHQYHEIKPVTNGIRYTLNFWFK